MPDQGYGSDDIHVPRYEVENTRQSTECGGQVHAGHQVC